MYCLHHEDIINWETLKTRVIYLQTTQDLRFGRNLNIFRENRQSFYQNWVKI